VTSARVGHAVADLAAAIREERDGAEILARVCRHARTLTGARAAAVFTVDDDEALVVRAVAGRLAVWRPGVRVPAGATVASRAVGSRTPVTAQLRRCWYPHERALVAGGLRRVYYLPVPRYGSTTALLAIGYRHGGAPTARELSRLEPMAAMAGLVPATYEADCARRRAGVEERAAAGERQWLARELHDSVEQALYAIGLGAATAGDLLRHDPARAEQPIAWVRETALAGLADLRGLILRLRPPALAGTGLANALARLLETVHRLYGVRTVAELGAEPHLSAEAEQALYRIAQEAVQNAAKHAGATQVSLRLGGHTSAVVLEVADDGKGFVPDGDFPGRLGLRSMRERAAAAGGRIEVVSAPARGTLVRAVLPAASTHAG
jgi:signal transduction histidine kinase